MLHACMRHGPCACKWQRSLLTVPLSRSGRNVCDLHHHADVNRLTADRAVRQQASGTWLSQIQQTSNEGSRWTWSCTCLFSAGVAVVFVMCITTLMASICMLLVWRLNPVIPVLFWLVLTFVEGIFLTAVLYKVCCCMPFIQCLCCLALLVWQLRAVVTERASSSALCCARCACGFHTSRLFCHPFQQMTTFVPLIKLLFCFAFSRYSPLSGACSLPLYKVHLCACPVIVRCLFCMLLLLTGSSGPQVWGLACMQITSTGLNGFFW